MEHKPETYDAGYQQGGYAGTYDLPYRHSCYYPLFQKVIQTLERMHAKKVLEVGCGSGGLSHMIFDRMDVHYQGFDFSSVAVSRAQARSGRDEAYAVADAKDPKSYEADYDAIICTEVLEHIAEDLEVIGLWRPGCSCVCSVPNFDSDWHVRYFRNEDEVVDRYGSLIDIDQVVRIKKPPLADISLRSYLQALRWNRYRPRRIRDILGFGDFDEVGGWFLFSGTKKGS